MASREFQIFAKPVGSTCNLRCRYCYYIDKNKLFHVTNHQMPDDILETYISQHIQATTSDVITFSWHGGEPLLAGIDFYRKVMKFQAANLPAGKTIINGIQTNGVLLNEKWARFLSDEKFVVGISLDGPAAFHNIHRRTVDDDGTFHSVMTGFQHLVQHGIIPEILCVLNAGNVSKPVVLYDFFKGLGIRYLTFLPLVEPTPGSLKGVSENSVPADAFGHFLSEIFDKWVENDIGVIKIQIFEEALRTAFKQEHTLCIFKENCGGVPVVEHNGDFFSCDHYVDSDHKPGNIKEKSLNWLLDCDEQKKFGELKSKSLPKYCIDCDVRAMCNGECPKNRIIKTPDGEAGLNYLCIGYKYFFSHCRPFAEAVAEIWGKQ